MSKVIDLLKTGVPDALEELKSLGKTLTARGARTSWPIPATPAPPTDPPKQSTAAWSTYAASPLDSETSQTTPYAASSTPEASATSYYTPKPEEPINLPKSENPKSRKTARPLLQTIPKERSRPPRAPEQTYV